MRHTLIIFALSIFALPASGQAFVSVGGSVFLDPGDLNDAYGLGSAFQGGLAFDGGGILVPRLFAYYGRNGLDEEGLDGGTYTMAGAGIDVLVRAEEGAVRPYIGPTFGAVSHRVSDLNVLDLVEVEFENTAGYTMGIAAGVEVPVGAVQFFGEGRLLHSFVKGQNVTWVPFSAGAVLRY